MSESMKQIGAQLIEAAQDFIIEKDSEGAQLVTAHVGDELTLTIMIIPTLTSVNIYKELGDALCNVADLVLSDPSNETG